MSHKLHSVWTIGVDEAKKEDYVKTILNSTIVLERLNKILGDYIEQIEGEEMKEENFSKPEWAVRQAFYLGQKKSLLKMKTIINGALNE